MEQYVNIDFVAKKYIVTKKTVRNWIKKGLPCVKIGNVLRFDALEVDDWIRNKSR